MVNGEDVRMWKWEGGNGDASNVTQYLNGLIKDKRTIGKDGGIVYSETHKEDGSIEFFCTEVKTGKRIDYFYTISSSGELLSQSILMDRVIVFLLNQHGAFNFVYDDYGKRATKSLSSRDPKFLIFQSLISEAFSL